MWDVYFSSLGKLSLLPILLFISVLLSKRPLLTYPLRFHIPGHGPKRTPRSSSCPTPDRSRVPYLRTRQTGFIPVCPVVHAHPFLFRTNGTRTLSSDTDQILAFRAHSPLPMPSRSGVVEGRSLVSSNTSSAYIKPNTGR